MMIFIRELNDWRRPGRPGNSKREKKNACGISCFFGDAKKTSGYNFNDFGVHFEVHFLIILYEKACFFADVFFLQFCDVFGRGSAAEAWPI